MIKSMTILSLLALGFSASAKSELPNAEQIVTRAHAVDEARQTLRGLKNGPDLLKTIGAICEETILNGKSGSFDVITAADLSLCPEDLAIILAKYSKSKP